MWSVKLYPVTIYRVQYVRLKRVIVWIVIAPKRILLYYASCTHTHTHITVRMFQLELQRKQQQKNANLITHSVSSHLFSRFDGSETERNAWLRWKLIKSKRKLFSIFLVLWNSEAIEGENIKEMYTYLCITNASIKIAPRIFIFYWSTQPMKTVTKATIKHVEKDR